MTSSNPGEAQIKNLRIGNINLQGDGNVLLTMSIYESIFVPATICDITIIDVDDNIGRNKFVGGETVLVEFKTDLPGSTIMKLELMLDRVSDTVSIGDQKGKIYTLNCVSPEAIQAKSNYVMKCYKDMLCSNMIKDIAKEYLHTNKEIRLQNTKGSQVILIPNMNPYHAISLIKKRSVANDNESSVFVFYEAREGTSQIYKFTTIEKLFDKKENAIIKRFKRDSTLNIKFDSQRDNNIISYKVNNQADATSTVRYTSAYSVNYELLTHLYTAPKARHIPNPGTTGGKVIISPELMKIIDGARHAPLSFIPSMFGAVPQTHMSSSNPQFLSYISALQQNSIRIRVPGDTNLTAGSLIYCAIPEQQRDPTNSKNEPMLSGTFLISRIHHYIGSAVEEPRYTCIIECIKAGYGDN